MTKIVNDQYLTRDIISAQCWDMLWELLDGFDLSQYYFVEPSVGKGSFVKTSGIDIDRWILFEIDESIDTPYRDNIHYGDFLDTPTIYKPTITVGNPPFGRRSKLAIEFINKSAQNSSLIAFILPIQFSKYLTQNKLNKDLELVLFKPLPGDAFESIDGKLISHLRTGFYVFAKDEFSGIAEDQRIYTRPPTAHPDFEMWQFNRTKETERYFDYDWDFAVLRQGYGDYNHLYTNKDDMDRKKQYIFFKAGDKQTLQRLKSLDFEELSLKNTTTPGFGKADVVEAYSRL